MILATGEVLSHKKYGDAYHSLTIVAPEIGAKIRPGQFINVRCGADRSHILRRPFSVYRVHKRGSWASTIEIVFDVRGPGSAYLSQLREHETVDLLGPLGRGFQFPRKRAHCLLVGGGIGATPLFFLADELRDEGHRVDVVMGARTASLLLNPIEARRLGAVCTITTDDGTMGHQGIVTDAMDDMFESTKTDVVYACGPHPMLAAVTRVATRRKVPVQVAVEELMACGYGVCMTCVMPLRVKITRGDKTIESVTYARSCTEGPVFNGAHVIWNGHAEPVTTEDAELAPVGLPAVHAPVASTDGVPPPGN